MPKRRIPTPPAVVFASPSHRPFRFSRSAAKMLPSPRDFPTLLRSVQYIARLAIDHIPAADLLRVPHAGRVTAISRGIRWNMSILYRQHRGNRAQRCPEWYFLLVNQQPIELQSYFCRVDLNNMSAEVSAARNPASTRERDILHHARLDRVARFALVRSNRGRKHHRNRDADWHLNRNTGLAGQANAREETTEDHQRRYTSKHLCRLLFQMNLGIPSLRKSASSLLPSSSTAIISRQFRSPGVKH